MDATLLRTSFDLIEPNKLAEVFYRRLFEAYPETRVLFAETDISAQAHKLAATLAIVVTSVEKGENVVPALRTLGERHRTYGVLPEHYPLVGKLLLEVLQDTLGSQWTPAYQEAWSQAFEFMAQTMLSLIPQ